MFECVICAPSKSQPPRKHISKATSFYKAATITTLPICSGTSNESQDIQVEIGFHHGMMSIWEHLPLPIASYGVLVTDAKQRLRALAV